VDQAGSTAAPLDRQSGVLGALNRPHELKLHVKAR